MKRRPPLAQFFFEYGARHGLSQQEIAGKIGMSASQLSLVQRSERTLTNKTRELMFSLPMSSEERDALTQAIEQSRCAFVLPRDIEPTQANWTFYYAVVRGFYELTDMRKRLFAEQIERECEECVMTGAR